jgi:hypothetical protein
MQVDKSKCIVCKQQTDVRAVHAENYSWRQATAINTVQAYLEIHRQTDRKKGDTPKHAVGKRQRSVQADKNADNRHGAEEVLYRQINRGVVRLVHVDS